MAVELVIGAGEVGEEMGEEIAKDMVEGVEEEDRATVEEGVGTATV